MAAFINVMNDFYPREVSRKVKQVKRQNAKDGCFIGSQPPYGYTRAPHNIHQLVIDEEAANNVRNVFQQFASGKNASVIARGLNRSGVLCPRAYHYTQKGKTNPNKQESMTWSSSTVMAMLRNCVYHGDMAQGKRLNVSYKSKKRRVTTPDEWIVVKNTHEAIIDDKTWDTVQKNWVQNAGIAHQKRIGVYLPLLGLQNAQIVEQAWQLRHEEKTGLLYHIAVVRITTMGKMFVLRTQYKKNC